MSKLRIILDTNILISYVLKPSAGMTWLVDSVLSQCCLLVSQDTFDELRNVIECFVKRGYVTVQESSEFLASIVETVEWIKILESIKVCRDPKDDKFLELSVGGKADYLITGDQDLLVFHQFRDTKIITPKDFKGLYHHSYLPISQGDK